VGRDRKVRGKSLDDIIYYFSEEDIRRLTEFAEQQGKQKPASNGQFIDDGKQENFTVSEIASLWKLSTDTIQGIFEDEPGVVVLGNKSPRAKRKRLTLRIPRAVVERVKKVRSNSRWLCSPSTNATPVRAHNSRAAIGAAIIRAGPRER
jgi:hypothetical protein